MKLYTCFIAYEASTAHLEALAMRAQYGTNRWEHLIDRHTKIRDGLIRRMERIELQLAQEKAKALELAEKKDYLD